MPRAHVLLLTIVVNSGASLRLRQEHLPRAIVAAPLEPTLRLKGGSVALAAPVALNDQLWFSLSLVHASLLGSLIGVERGWAGRPAGIRTMSLVAMGAALFTGVGRLSFSDSARLAAQVASGVGFLGAGVIHSLSVTPQGKYRRGAAAGGDWLYGLTTASAIWLCAGIGVACGAGLGVVATAATILSIAILWSYRIAYGGTIDELGVRDIATKIEPRRVMA